MALYRLEVQGIQRAQGRSVVAAAAYRAGAALYDQRLEMAFDYSKRDGVEHTEIMAPQSAPAAFGDHEALWNAAEAADKRSDSRPAREILLALPHELNAEQRLALVRAFLADHVVSKGMIADFALHAPDKHGDQRNHHAHVLVTTREVSADGFGRKVEAWTKPQLVRDWRAGWAEVQNRHLERALGPAAPKVTDRSLADQGEERGPTIHLGPAASAMERRGQRSDRGDVNRSILDAGREREGLEFSISRTEDELAGTAPKGPRGAQALARELGALHHDLLRENARLAKTRDEVVVPAVRQVASVTRELIDPALAARSEARSELARTEGRIEAVRNRRMSLHRWLTNPGRMIWAKHAELNALAAARADVRRAEAQLRVRRTWLASDAGKTYVAALVEPGQLAAKAAHTQRRTLERRMRRIANRAEAVENVRVKTLLARELGHQTLEIPARTFGVTQLVRAVDSVVLAAIGQHPPEAQRRAYQRVRDLGRSRPRDMPPL